jgi:hypothetical protein
VPAGARRAVERARRADASDGVLVINDFAAISVMGALRDVADRGVTTTCDTLAAS